MVTLKSFKLIPRRTAIIHLSWLGVLLLFILAVIVPVQRFIAGLDGRIKDIQYRVDEQKGLQPIYQALKARSRTTAPSILPTPESGKLSRDLVSVVPSTIGRIVRNAAMETISISPDVNSLANQSRSLLMHTVIRGDFMSFRKFLIGVGELPYLERFEEVEIRQDPDFMEFRMKIRLALS
ncbi:MAG: hypothetical protein ABIJ25_02025 [Pseudomonadota bacterium]